MLPTRPDPDPGHRQDPRAAGAGSGVFAHWTLGHYVLLVILLPMLIAIAAFMTGLVVAAVVLVLAGVAAVFVTNGIVEYWRRRRS